MVNSHAKTVVFSLIASTPIIHVTPSRGNKIEVLFRADLYYKEDTPLSTAIAILILSSPTELHTRYTYSLA